MDCFMPALKNAEQTLVLQRRLSKSVVLILLYLSTTGPASATGITIQSCATHREGDIYVLDADIQFDISENALEALKHGIALQIHTILRLKKDRNWLWDSVLKETVLRYRMEHHPLSGHYMVTDLLTGVRHTYPTLEGAVGFLTILNNIPFFESNLLKENESYTGNMRTQLDIESLPASLRPVAYLSSNWQLSSPWHSWEITR